MLSGTIERRPWALIAAWIIVALLLAPYAARLDSVMKTETREFLPPHVESVRAEKELNKLYNQTGAERMEADYLVMVHGVPVGLDTYYKLKEPYMRVNVSGASKLSWIDIVAGVEENISAGMETGLNGSVMLLDGALRVNSAYLRLLNGTQGMVMLVEGADRAYAALARNATLLAGQAGNLTLAARTLCLACSYQRLEARMLFDVVRAEALLESVTSAYQNGTLTPSDIAAVVEASNLSQAGIEPLSPELVALVFNTTMSLGGPGNWSNSVALDLARQLALQALASRIGSDNVTRLEPVLGAAHEGLASAVQQVGDLRAPILGEGPAQGQVDLLNIIMQAQSAAEEPTLRGIASSLGSGGNEDVLQALVDAVRSLGCDPSKASDAVVMVAAGALEEGGVPEGLAQAIAADIVDGRLDNYTLLAQAATSIVAARAQGRVPEQVLEALPGLLLQLDPSANGTLIGTSLGYAAAAALTLSAATGEPPSSGLVESLAEGVQSPGDAAYNALLAMLSARDNRSVALAEALRSAGLLGESNETILNRAPEVLAPMLASMAGNATAIDNETARALLSAAASVLRGEKTREDAVRELTRSTLEKAWPEIEERIKGVLVEKDLNGFLVLMVPRNGSLEENVERLSKLEEGLDSALRSAGFSGYELVKGGTDFMTYEMREAVLRDVQRSDRMSMVFVLLVMAIVLESIAAVFLPFIGIGFGLALSMAGAYFLAKAGLIDVTSHSRTIMYSTGLGLGIDYAVYVSRSFREAAREGLPSRRAAAEAFRRSWKPVIAGATTAMIGFGSMLLAGEFSFISSIGATVPLTIFMVMLASITFIPALLAYVGEKGWFWWPRHPFKAKQSSSGPSLGLRAGRAVVRIAPVLLIAAVLAGIAGYAVVSGYQGSYDISLNLPEDTESYKFIHEFNSLYDPGVLYPIYVVASSPGRAEEINRTVAGLDCVSKTRVPEDLGRVVYVYTKVNPLSYDGVECAEQVREAAHRIDPESLVGGMGATNLDLKNEITSVFYGRVYPVAIVLMFLTMMLAYGGALTALAAVLGIVAAAYLGSALAIAVYEHVKGLPVLWYLPVITFTAILGVGMDYNSFYLARARRECEAECSREAVARSIALGTPVVLGLSTIMASAYLGLALTKTPGIASMGLALLLGVLSAGVYAGIALTPPIIALLGRHAWWPRPPGRGGK